MSTRRATAAALRALRAPAPLALRTARARAAAPHFHPAVLAPARAVRWSSSEPTYVAADLSAQEYNRRVDASLEELTSQLEELLETEDIDEIERTRGEGGSLTDWDVEYAVRARQAPPPTH